MASSRRWARTISFIASLVYFLIIILQVPLFRAPCRIGTCTSPIEVISSHLIATQLYPAFGVKAMLYPGAIAKAFINRKPIPSYSKLSKLYNFTNMRKSAGIIVDLNHMEILAGSYLAVAGVMFRLMGLNRISLYGIILILWGCIREVVQKKSANMRAVHVYPVTMIIAVLCAFLSIRKDVRMLIRCCHNPRPARYLRSKAKIM